MAYMVIFQMKRREVYMRSKKLKNAKIWVVFKPDFFFQITLLEKIKAYFYCRHPNGHNGI